MTEIATSTSAADIEVLPPARPMASEAIGQLMAHADAMAAAKQLGDALADTDMVPKDYKGKPGNAAAAILYGAELGLNPIQSLQQIFVIHGSPAIYARTAVALVKRHGVLVETLSSDNESVTVRATDRRTEQVEEATWDIGRATLAGYTANKKYETNPQEMLYAKAAMEVCRKIAPDVLLGIPYSREELELEERPQRVRSERGGRGVSALRERAQQAQIVEAQPGEPDHSKGDMSPATRKKWQNRMFQLLNEADVTDRDDQLTVIRNIASIDVLEHRDATTDDQLRTIVNTLNKWAKDGTTDDQLREILNGATLSGDEGTLL